MIGTIVPFELRTRFRSPLTWLMLVMMVFQGVWFPFAFYDNYVHDETLINGAGNFYICLSGGGIILMIIIAMITGMSLYRDIEERTALFLYAFPVSEKRFFLGRFFGAYIINLLLVLAYMLGMVIMPYLGVGPADKFGPVPWLQLMHGYVLFGVTNMFVLTAVCYFCVVQFRNMAASYIGIFVMVMIFFISEVVSANTPYIDAIIVINHFGYVYAKEVIDGLPIAQKNTGFLPVEGIFLLNRLIWTGIGLLAVIYSYKRFSFRYFVQAVFGSRGKKPQNNTRASHDATVTHVTVPGVSRVFSIGEHFRKLGRFSLTEFLDFVRPVSFKVVLMVIAVMFFLYMVLWNPVYYVGSQVPLTSGMTSTRLHTNFMVIILVMVWAGELFFKDRTAGLWQVTDTTPMPSWVVLLSRYIAMCGVALMVLSTMFVSGLVAQVGQGFFDIDWQLYASDLLGYRFGWMTYVFYITLVFFIAGLSGNRFFTHVVCIGYFIFMAASFDLDLIEQVRFGYGFTPGIGRFSEMNRYGILSESAGWYFLLWVSLAIPFLIAGIRFWNRGSEKGVLKRVFSLRGEFGWGGVALSLVGLVMFFVLQSFLITEINTKRNYVSASQEDIEAAMYEKRFGEAQSFASPRITAVDLRLDLYPQEQAVDYKAELTLDNPSGKPVERLFVNADYFTEIRSITMGGTQLEKLEIDKVLGMEVYALPDAMAPGDVRSLVIGYRRSYHGLSQGEPHADIAYNGLFMERPVPVIGYDSGKELQENNERKANGLDMLDSRMDPVDDPVSLVKHYLATDAAFVTGTITVSTPATQTAFAPGMLVRRWEENGRNHFRYELEKPSPLHWYVGSADYAEEALTVGETEVTLLYKKDHIYNLDLYSEALEEGMVYLESHLGVYPYTELRVAEIPFYQDPFYAFANTIAISEKEGWYGDRNNPDVRSFIRFSIMKELIRHWVLENARLADVQGVEMLWTALPDALAMGFLEQKDGKKRVEHILEKKRRRYGKDRGMEPNQEPPLLYADGIDYLEENKGALALYHLSRSIGHQELLGFVREWFESRKEAPLVFRDFYEYLKERIVLDETMMALFESVEKEMRI
ncbi:ABC transporter permease [Prosthecochloris sp. SCSIO W1101]|uniref:ABC transporter permease/M1 family aminopeptidase n=1 Tax=Prosthecochloris sp. SCSIO W1101 TaxID=2992242 RepID=UPI00223C93C0|nr:ABC transporter permease [Prosthecochloris sp. SCSIO W1101]UZJ40733.1 ABC transporter permease [Prosthecochloris sp. SCSIO W1101]